MLIVDSADVPELPSWYRHWVYNTRDACITAEIDAVLPLDDTAQRVYDFEMSMYPMCFTLMDRGVRVDQRVRVELTIRYAARLTRLEQWLNFMSDAVQGKPLNPRSPAQIMELFYEVMKLPVQYKKDRFSGESRPSVDRAALEKLENYIYARPFVLTLMKLRDIEKTLQVLRAKLHPDGRMRFRFNPAGTETQRWSSGKNPDRTGMNFQNITHDLRKMFIPDPGFRLGYADLTQAESRAVAYLSRDYAYIDACESGDLHSAVAKMIWPGCDPKEVFYRNFTRRDIAKRAGHASNYKGKPYTIAKTSRVDESLIDTFQKAYFQTFTGISRWHHEIEEELTSRGELLSPTGFRRQFLKRLRDEQTLKEAIAFKPQNIVGYAGAKGMKDIFDTLEPHVQVLGNMHDAVVFQYPVDKPFLADEATRLFGAVEIDYPGIGKRSIPAELKVGYNWADLADPSKAHEQVPPDYNAGLLNVSL